ncbi:MAG TPA: NHLP leader peptide family RiPP precursor [Gemmatimonadales bacterium]|nr:NHLP leader peptide family RiPP precursor [Gemmatimonadales bacterium]
MARAPAKRIIAKTWRDEAFRRRLLRSPHKVLQEEGVRVPKGVKVKVVQNTGRVFHFVLPAKPGRASTGAKGPKRPGRMGPQFTIPV